MVEFGQTDGTDQLVRFSNSTFNSCQVPVSLPFWEARMKKSREMELKLAKVRISLCHFFKRFCCSARLIVSWRKYMSKTGDCRNSILDGCNTVG